MLATASTGKARGKNTIKNSGKNINDDSKKKKKKIIVVGLRWWKQHLFQSIMFLPQKENNVSLGSTNDLFSPAMNPIGRHSVDGSDITDTLNADDTYRW